MIVGLFAYLIALALIVFVLGFHAGFVLGRLWR